MRTYTLTINYFIDCYHYIDDIGNDANFHSDIIKSNCRRKTYMEGIGSLIYVIKYLNHIWCQYHMPIVKVLGLLIPISIPVFLL